MAPGLRRWIFAVLGGCALVAVWALPPRDQQTFFELLGARFRAADQSPPVLALRELRSRANQAAEIYQRLRWRDSLAVLAVGAQGPGSHSFVALPEFAPPEARRELETALETQLRLAGVAEPRVPVGVVLLEAMTLAHSWQVEARQGFWMGTELMISTDPRSPFCVLVEHFRSYPGDTVHLELNRARQRRTVPVPGAEAPSPLGPCIYHARYGNPGPEILRWLASTAYAFASDPGSSPSRSAAPPSPGDLLPRLALFGRRTARRYSDLLPDAEGCLMGDQEACRKVITIPPLEPAVLFLGELEGGAEPAADPLTLKLGRYDATHFLGADAFLFRDMEEEFGRERFQRFWSSDLPVAEAFQEAFGEALGAWVTRWAQERFGVLRPAPPLRAGATLLTLLLVGALAGVAVVTRGRRR